MRGVYQGGLWMYVTLGILLIAPIDMGRTSLKVAALLPGLGPVLYKSRESLLEIMYA